MKKMSNEEFAERVSKEVNSKTSLEARSLVFLDCPDWQPRLTLARDDRLPTYILERLAKDKDPMVRAQALRTLKGEPTTLRHIIGLDIYTARLSLGMSRNAVAEKISRMTGTSFRQNAYRDIEEGKTNYTIDRLECVLNALGIGLTTLVDYPDEDE